jgi:hypothetical protein
MSSWELQLCRLFCKPLITSKEYLKLQVLPHRKHTASTITMINQLMLFREMITVYCENDMEHTDILFGQKSELLKISIFTTSKDL